MQTGRYFLFNSMSTVIVCYSLLLKLQGGGVIRGTAGNV